MVSCTRQRITAKLRLARPPGDRGTFLLPPLPQGHCGGDKRRHDSVSRLAVDVGNEAASHRVCHPERSEEPVPSVAEGIWPPNGLSLSRSILSPYPQARCFTSFSMTSAAKTTSFSLGAKRQLGMTESGSRADSPEFVGGCVQKCIYTGSGIQKCINLPCLISWAKLFLTACKQ